MNQVNGRISRRAIHGVLFQMSVARTPGCTALAVIPRLPQRRADSKVKRMLASFESA